MINTIIERCLENGFKDELGKKPDGVLYEILNSPKIVGINGTVEHEEGLTLLPITTLADAARELRTEVYVVDFDRGVYASSSEPSRMFGLDADQGKRLGLVLKDELPEAAILKMYSTLFGKKQEGYRS